MTPLTPSERVVAWTIALRGAASTADLISQLYGNDHAGGPVSATDVVHAMVLRLRAKMRGVGIESVGRRYVATDRTAMLDWLATEIARNAAPPRAWRRAA